MSTRTRDNLALYLIAALAVAVTLSADADPGQMVQALLARL